MDEILRDLRFDGYSVMGFDGFMEFKLAHQADFIPPAKYVMVKDKCGQYIIYTRKFVETYVPNWTE